MRFSRACLVASILALCFALGCGTARAASVSDAIAHFTADDFSETLTGIKEIAGSGDPRAETILRALQDGQLQFSAQRKTVYIKDSSGKLTDAATGEPIGGETPADTDTVRINNRLRGALDAALGGLTLLAKSPVTRYDAAQAVFKSRQASALPTLDTAIAKEPDLRVKRAMQEARAAIVLSGTASDEDKLAAVDIIRQRGDQDALGLLASVPANTSPAVMKAVAAGISTIQNRLALWEAVQNAWYGISLGSVLLLAAIGLAITFGVMGVINMAHGEMVMLGAYVTFVVQDIIRTNDPALFDYSLAIAIPASFLVAGCVGILVERCIIRFLYGRPLETLLATWGLSLILQQAVRTTFGPNNREVGNPSWMSGAFDVGGITVTYNRLWIICFAIAVFVALLALLRFTRFGLEMRAVTQ
ncbi:MAG: urea ABC transporter permease subunit UrtB, partial [Xanthobacteraceae bacterium]